MATSGKSSRRPATLQSSSSNDRVARVVDSWRRDGKGNLEDFWAAAREVLSTVPHEREGQSSLTRSLWDAILSVTNLAGVRDRLALPEDVARNAVELCSRLLDSSAASGEREPPHAALRLLAHAARDTQLKVDDLPVKLASLITRAARGVGREDTPQKSSSRSSNGFRTASLSLACLAQVSEHAPTSLHSAAQEVSDCLLAAVRHLGDNAPSLKLSASGPLRDVSTLLLSLPSVLAEVHQPLESSALVLLASLQTCAVIGAQYVVRSRTPTGAAAPSNLSSETERSEADVARGGLSSPSSICPSSPASTTGLLDRVFEDAAAATETLAAQCRMAALRTCAQMFRLWPKAFFGRWPLVLDFQSGEALLAGSYRGNSGSLPMLLAICELDPSPKVRSAALQALCALLDAPSVRTWPMPLESGAAAPGRGGASAYTSMSVQVATTIRQTHAVVFGMLSSSHFHDVQAALRACADITTSTPYTKLAPGLLSQVVWHAMPFVGSLARLQALEGQQSNVTAALPVLNAALKREDCIDELKSALFTPCPKEMKLTKTTVDEQGASVVDKLLAIGLHVASLSRQPQSIRGGASAATASPGVPPRPEPAAARRRKGSQRGGGYAAAEAASSCNPDPSEAALSLDYMAMMNRVIHLRPPVLPEKTREATQALIDALLDQPGASLRVRGRRLLEEYLRESSSSSDAEKGGGSDSSSTAVAEAKPTHSRWCASMAHRLLAALPAETAAPVRVATLAALPPLALAAMVSGGDAAATLRPHALASMRAGACDTNSSVRTTAAQSVGALAKMWLISEDGSCQEGIRVVLQLVSSLFSDSVADVKSAAITAVASLATVVEKTATRATDGTGGADKDAVGASACADLWQSVAEGALVLCNDRSEKVRASTFRAIGFIAEVLGPDMVATAAPCSADAGGAPLLDAPPGLAPPGLAAVEELTEQRRPAGVPLLSRFAEALAAGVGTPPPKCQWNACRAIGQLYHELLQLPREERVRAHQTLLAPLVQEVAGASNMKVRIQAVQALLEVPPDPAFWEQSEADAIVTALCDALEATRDGASLSMAASPAESKHLASYLQTLRDELNKLAERWASCAVLPPGVSARMRLEASATDLVQLCAKSADAADAVGEGRAACGDGWGQEEDEEATSKPSPSPSVVAARLSALGIHT